ncbi:serine protease [Armillaria borealis]|uniref:Serine protease n=1 Tax=Armillaria borealis TaxID=47425 RepID=A0AA39MPY6_9AGAR|nr:serine protease [Armillaria borealis]
MASTQPDTTTLTDITALTKLQRIDGKVKKDNYIVTLRPGVARSTRDTLVDSLGPEATITARYNHVFSGFAGQFSSGHTNELPSDVVTIVEDSEVYANVEQHDATWGLQRISQEGPLPPGSDPLSDTLPSISAYLNSTTLSALTYTYTYDGTVTSLVNIYVLDTGIYTENSDFGGRAHWGVTMIGSDGDRRGHGTHVAGTIGGTRFGVYKFAEIYDVKVLDDNGAGTASSVIAGLDWTHNNALRPAVVNMSLGSPANTAIDSAVVAVINSGITTVVSAGNTNIDASLRSPARVEQAITVGASTIADARASFSNFGFDHFPISSMYLLSVRLSIRSVVDVFAPGQDITSTWIGQVDATHTISGTSMAAPHVTGVAAYFLAQQTELETFGNRGRD